MIDLNGISFAYGQKEVLKDISFSLKKGQFIGLLGPNGSGKSTLLKLMAGILTPTSGQVFLENKDIRTIDGKTFAKKVAFLPQVKQIRLDLTVEELVGFGRYPHLPWHKRNAPSDLEKIDLALSQTALMDFKPRPLNTLSGGEAQRAFIAMALAQESPILLLDEPTTFLDVAHQLDVLNLLKTLNQENGHTIVMVIHDINQAIRYCDTIHVLKEGRLIDTVKAKEAFSDGAIAHAFDVDIRVGYDSVNECPFGLMDRRKKLPAK